MSKQHYISQEKLKWMKEIGIKKFEEPMLYYLGANVLYSEKFLSETPFEELEEKSNKILADKGSPIIIKNGAIHYID